MNWWKNQCKIKRFLLLTAAAVFFAGISGASAEAAVGGTAAALFFWSLSCFFSKKQTHSPEEQAWQQTIRARVPEKEKLWTAVLSAAAIVFMVVSAVLLLIGIYREAYVQTGLFTFIFFAAYSSWLYLNPAVYNTRFSRSKIVPFAAEKTLEQLYCRIGAIETPFGKPVIGRAGNTRALIYGPNADQWAVYFYPKGNEVRVRSKYLNEDAPTEQSLQAVSDFTAQLCALLCYWSNTGKVPDREGLRRIFENGREAELVEAEAKREE